MLKDNNVNENWESVHYQALEYFKRGNYLKAIKRFKVAIVYAEKEFGKMHINYASSIISLAQVYREYGQYQQAQLLYEKVGDIIKSTSNTNYKNYIIYLIEVGNLYVDQGYYHKAHKIYAKTKRIFFKRNLAKDTTYAKLLNSIGALYQHEGRPDKAEAYFLETLDIASKFLNKNHIKYLIYTKNLATFYGAQGQYRKATELYLKIEKKLNKKLRKDHPYYVNLLNNLGTLYLNQQLYDKAKAVFLEGLNIAKKQLGDTHPDYALLLHNLAFLYRELGLFKKADSIQLKAIDIRKEVLGVEHFDYAISLHNLAISYCTQGIFGKADKLLWEVEKIYNKSLERENTHTAILLYNLSNTYHIRGLREKSKLYYFRSQDMLKKIIGTQHPDYLTTLVNLGYIYLEQDSLKMAEKTLLKALRLSKKLDQKKGKIYARSLNDLVTLYLIQNKNKEARKKVRKGLKVIEKRLGTDHYLFAEAMLNLAFVHYYDKQYVRSIKCLMQGLRLHEEKFGEYHPEQIPFYTLLSILYREAKLYDQVIVCQAILNQIILNQVDISFPFFSEKEKESYLKTVSKSFHDFHSFTITSNLMKKDTIIILDYYYTLKLKSILLNESTRFKQKILASQDTIAINLYETWMALRKQIASYYEKPIKVRDNLNIDVKILIEEVNKIEKRLSYHSEKFATITDNKNYTWLDIQKQLKSQEAAIELIKFRHKSIAGAYIDPFSDPVTYMAMIITPETQDHPEVVVLGNSDQLDSEYLKNYQQIEQNVETLDTLSYQYYWGPIAEKLKGIKKVYLSADGVYYRMNLLGLYNPATDRYLADELDIHLVTSTKDLLKPKRNRKPKSQACLFASPDYNLKLTNAPSDSTSSPYHLSPLKGTKQEVKNLEKILLKKSIDIETYVEQEATEQVVKAVENPKILHIGSHGFFHANTGNYAESNQLIGALEPTDVLDNSLFRSGIALAGINHTLWRGGEGALTANEVMNLNLDETELVVLSACSSGLGEIQTGEGVWGLQRAFQVAGAANVLVSLWNVDDDATQELMTQFYLNWLEKGQPKREAFRNAQKYLREGDFPEPYFWASFVMVGE